MYVNFRQNMQNELQLHADGTTVIPTHVLALRTADNGVVTFPDDFGDQHYEFTDEEIVMWSQQSDRKILKLLRERGLALDRLAELLGNNISRAAKIYRAFCKETSERAVRGGGIAGRTFKNTVLRLSSHLRRRLPNVQASIDARASARGGAGADPGASAVARVVEAATAAAAAAAAAATAAATATAAVAMDSATGTAATKPRVKISISPRNSSGRSSDGGDTGPGSTPAARVGWFSGRGSRPQSPTPSPTQFFRQHQLQEPTQGAPQLTDGSAMVTASSPEDLRDLVQALAPHLPCSGQDLERPTFRFTYLVLSTVMKKTGFAEACLQPFERLYGRDQCLDFLNSVIRFMREAKGPAAAAVHPANTLSAKLVYDGSNTHHCRHFLCSFLEAAIFYEPRNDPAKPRTTKKKQRKKPHQRRGGRGDAFSPSRTTRLPRYMSPLRRERPVSSGGVRLSGSIGVDPDMGLVQRKPRQVYTGKSGGAQRLSSAGSGGGRGRARGSSGGSGSGELVLRFRSRPSTGTSRKPRAQTAPPQLRVHGGAPREQWT